MAYYKLDPFGYDRIDMGAGIVASTLVNFFKKKGTKATKFTEFMPEFGPRAEPVKKSGKDLLKIAEVLNQAFGGRDLRKK